MCSVLFHTRPHHIGAPLYKANVKIIIELKFVIEVKWLKCIETTTTKKVIGFAVKILWRPHRNGAHSA